MPELTVVVPAYRERENIPTLLEALERALEGRDWETIVVVDDADDGSEQLVRERAQRDARVRCLQRIGRRGLASACVEGMLASSAPYIAVIDADMQHDETLLSRMLRLMSGHDLDLVVGSRYVSGGSIGDWSASRRAMSKFATKLSHLIMQFDLTDPMSGFFMVRRRFLERVVRRLYGRGFKILLDLIAAARSEVRISEVPYRMRSRQRGESKLGLRVMAEFFVLLLYHLFGRLLPARFFLFCAVGVTGVGVHLAVLTAVFQASGGQFLASQALATLAAMTSNFFLNNAFTYADQRVRGRQVWRALVSFYLACGIGSIVNLAVAEWLYLHSGTYWLAGIVGALTAAFWNFFTTASFTWGAAARSRE
jgi:dolichol-phosphate mannosyltransferase